MNRFLIYCVGCFCMLTLCILPTLGKSRKSSSHGHNGNKDDYCERLNTDNHHFQAMEDSIEAPTVLVILIGQVTFRYLSMHWRTCDLAGRSEGAVGMTLEGSTEVGDAMKALCCTADARRPSGMGVIVPACA